MSNSELQKSYSSLKMTVNDHFPTLRSQLHAFLSAVASLCWNDCSLPIAMIACGPSGSGKTEPLLWIMRGYPDLIVRSDDFTAASFVSHAANVKKKELEKNDLLPRIKNKCLCTKEMAPIFSGREDFLKTNFAKLTSVLDGEGLVSSSGTHGTRGYTDQINFCWLGATTPPSKKVFNLMAQLGTRLFFYSTDSKRPKAEDYANFIKGKTTPHHEAKQKCTEATGSFLSKLFNTYPIRSTLSSVIKISDGHANQIGLLCEALSLLRGSVSIAEGVANDEDRFGSPAIEHGWRAAQVLSVLAKSSALVRGTSHVEQEDLDFIQHVCLSSMPEYRRKVFEGVLRLNGTGQASDIARIIGMAKKTAIHYLKELHTLGVIDYIYGITEYTFHLKDELKPLLKSTNTGTNSVTSLQEKSDYQGSTVTENAPVCAEPPSFDNLESKDWIDDLYN